MWQREILVAVIVSKTREFWVKKEVVLGPGTELSYVLRSIYKSDTQGIVEKGVSRELGKREKGESEWRGISGFLAHTKNESSDFGGSVGHQTRRVPVSHHAGDECAVGTLRASATDWR